MPGEAKPRRKRGRQSIASKILEDLDDTHEEASFLVCYDFRARANLPFYKNLEIIIRETQDGIRVQKSLIKCKKLRTAQAIKRLVEHYDASALLFKIEELE